MEFKTTIEANYGITIKPITLRNPQANSILERVHQTIGNIIRTFKVQDMVLNNENPWDGILACTMFTLRATVHTTMQHTPAQLVFGQDSILNTRHKADWQLVKKRKQDEINKGNQRKNLNQKEHMCNTGDKVLLENTWKTKFNQDAYLGPYTITAVRNNDTVRTCKRIIIDTFNICNITLFKIQMLFHYGAV